MTEPSDARSASPIRGMFVELATDVFLATDNSPLEPEVATGEGAGESQLTGPVASAREPIHSRAAGFGPTPPGGVP